MRRERNGGSTHSQAEPGIRSEDQETDYNKRNPPGCDSDVRREKRNYKMERKTKQNKEKKVKSHARTNETAEH